MENVSKAIIIAGAVLVVLLIISLSIYFYYQSTDIIDIYGKKISATEIKNHNNTFLGYDGELVGNEVVNVCVKAKEYNTSSGLPITVVVKLAKNSNKEYSFGYGDIGDYETILNEINRTRIYKSQVKYSGEGIINRIEIKPK